MQVEGLTIDDWLSCRSWYEHRGDSLPLEEYLPMSSGFVVKDEKGPVAVGFLIITNTKMALMEFLMTNHERSERDQGKALLKLARYIEGTAAKLGFKVIMGFTPEDHDPLARFYFREGAVRATKVFRLFYKGLKGEG